jgi:UDP-glucuronate 4-epimerase|tara:strand:- start:451 stop:1530 length:1080 start_codon:yes stop_codon:yes gene_type:complete
MHHRAYRAVSDAGDAGKTESFTNHSRPTDALDSPSIARYFPRVNILVTGGVGFIGSHVCEHLLEAGHTVCALDDLNDFYEPAIKQNTLRELQSRAQSFSFVHADITNHGEVNEVLVSMAFDQIIHLAARAGVRPSLENPALYQRVNVEGTANVLEAAREHGVNKITIASSSSVYGVNSQVPFRETDPVFRAISPYAASKLACEALGHVYHHVHGMDICVLRFFTVYGPRQRPDLAIHKFAQLIHSGRPIPVFGDGGSSRDYTYVNDTVDGVLATTEKEFGFEIINLGESQTVELDRLIGLIEQAMGEKADINRQPGQPGDVPVTFANIEKAQRLLGYNPQTKIEDGIPRFIKWFRQQNP